MVRNANLAIAIEGQSMQAWFGRPSTRFGIDDLLHAPTLDTSLLDDPSMN
jgi:hypothetical protein